MSVRVFDYDFIVVGSGFGGSVAGLRLVEKGYRVLMVEKGREIAPEDLPRTNWDLRRWLWLPALGFRGFFRMSFFRHVTVLSGVSVGGGSTGYAATHPMPKPGFFQAPSWSALADWPTELAPHYARAREMLGVTPNPRLEPADEVLATLVRKRGEENRFHPTDVAIYFGAPGQTVPDPFFSGEGPPRTGCIRCGGCMLGCRHGAKNTLDKNYLHLARAKGLEIRASHEVRAVRALDNGGYAVEIRPTGAWWKRSQRITARRVVLAGGVLGTLDLLLRMKADPLGLPRVSDRLGQGIRTNSESLIGVISHRPATDFSAGIAIGSGYEPDENAHLEVVRYNAGSGFFRLLMAPHVSGANTADRLAKLLSLCIRKPRALWRALTVSDLSRQTPILMYMRATEGTLRLTRGWHGRLATRREEGPAPTASIPEATALAHAYAREVDGFPFSMATETLFDIPTTAHVLGGACMAADAQSGVIDRDHRVFGYDGLYVVDGASVSANPGVNPSLTICALAERAMSKIPPLSAEAGRP